ncbi:MAG: radical SAM protein [Clostridiales bacterium]|nr:radical SAM protein [Clostridiales bacterium]
MSATPYQDIFAGMIELSLGTAARILAAYPASAAAFARLSRTFTAAERKRAKLAQDGIQVPPIMIISTTEVCNLSCAGCYACCHEKKSGEEMSHEQVEKLLDEASELGVSIVMLAGGEPLLSHDWLETMGCHEEMLGIVFTNGTLFDENRCKWFDGHRHMIPTFSLEGNQLQTDTRRGAGVYEKVNEAMIHLLKGGIPFGISLTVTSQNIDSLLREESVREYIHKGCRLFMFVEYVPVEKGSEPMVLSKADKKRLNDFAVASGKQYPALFIPFPGDEERYDGCLAAGRGFVYVSADGDLEPCPFAPFSDTNLKHVTLREGLTSGLLTRVRQNHHLFKEGEGGCALWHNREELTRLLHP